MTRLQLKGGHLWVFKKSEPCGWYILNLNWLMDWLYIIGAIAMLVILLRW